MFFVYLNTISLFCLVPFQLYTDILSFLVDRHKLPLRRKSRIMRKGGICRTVSVFGHAYKNKCGFITGNVLDGSVLIVNTDLIGDIKIEG